MKLSGEYTIIETRDNHEPMHCERRGCNEELNGLNNFFINLGEGYIMDMWLCDKCADKFRKVFK